MKIKIRSNVFETNSSSIHSLTFSNDGLEESYLPVDKDGYILTDFGNFGKEYRTYFRQEDKLSYLITLLYYLNNESEQIYNYYDFKTIQDTVCEYTGAKGIKILGETEPYIDHQSIPDYDIEIVNIYNTRLLINFIFNKNVGLQTDCD